MSSPPSPIAAVSRSPSAGPAGRVATAPPARSTRSIGLGHLAGLDGLRAIAVIAVVVYHAGLGWLPGGFLGVEVFFVISGYLITALLLVEHAIHGRIDLRAFWMRRARRLLPALGFLLLASLAFAVVVLPHEVARLRADALAAALYVANWHQVVAEQSYFETVGRPSLFLHLWSLGIEEQFYLLWPVILGVLLLAGRRVALALTLAGAVLSTVWMAILFAPDLDPSRVYYGTDTRLVGLLLGSALAFVWIPGAVRAGRHWTDRHWADRRTGRVLDIAALGGLAALGAFFLAADAVEPFLYQGGFALLGLITIVVIAATVHPMGRVGRLLDREPMRWIGTRSYSIYLWHWPVFMVTRPGLDVPLDPMPALGLRLLLTIVLAEVSYRLVETPIRRGALGRAWHGWRTAPPATRPAWLRWPAPAAGGLGMAFSVLLVSVAVATPEPPPEHLGTGSIIGVLVPPIETAGPIGTDGRPDGPDLTFPVAPRPPVAAPAGYPRDERDDRPQGRPGTDGEPTTGDPTGAPAAPGTPTRSPGATSAPPVLAFGDSVMVQGAEALAAVLGPIQVDAAIGRQVADGIAALQARADAGTLPPTVILQLGNNGPFRATQFDDVMAVLADVDHVIWVNLRVPRDWEQRNNKLIRQGVQQYANARLVDWYGATEGRRELFWNDGYHPRPKGAALYAKLVLEAMP
jgi:peptidoglycan/LPS O-acetylase OafA/YrhL